MEASCPGCSLPTPCAFPAYLLVRCCEKQEKPRLCAEKSWTITKTSLTSLEVLVHVRDTWEVICGRWPLQQYRCQQLLPGWCQRLQGLSLSFPALLSGTEQTRTAILAPSSLGSDLYCRLRSKGKKFRSKGQKFWVWWRSRKANQGMQGCVGKHPLLLCPLLPFVLIHPSSPRFRMMIWTFKQL